MGCGGAKDPEPATDEDKPVVVEELEPIIKKLVRPVKGFPNPDFTFGDITPLLADGAAFGKVIDAFAERYSSAGIVAVAAPEARGFFFGPPLAKALGVGFLPIRKKDQLPGETHKSDLVKMECASLPLSRVLARRSRLRCLALCACA